MQAALRVVEPIVHTSSVVDDRIAIGEICYEFDPVALSPGNRRIQLSNSAETRSIRCAEQGLPGGHRQPLDADLLRDARPWMACIIVEAARPRPAFRHRTNLVHVDDVAQWLIRGNAL